MFLKFFLNVTAKVQDQFGKFAQRHINISHTFPKTRN